MIRVARNLARFNRNRAERSFATAAYCFVLLTLMPHSALGQALTPAWVELGPNGAALARIVVSAPADCPRIRIDRSTHEMSLRQPIPPNFRPLCEFAIPAKAKSARVGAQLLKLPKPNPTRVIAFGDTGCRLKGLAVQACNDPEQWPFAKISAQAATEKADLMIHVGDYLYREMPCPTSSESICGGTPDGDNWPSWDADFFAPAAKLLAAVPWAVSRGNHEDCTRAWRGWFYYLDPRPWTGLCEEYSKPYLVTLGSFELVMLDSSASDTTIVNEDQVTEFTSQLLSLHPKNAWLVDHHPFWGFTPLPLGLGTVALSAPLEEAWKRAHPSGYTLFLSGHIHLFEFINLDRDTPDQLVVGDGGTMMEAPIKSSIAGSNVRGITVPSADTEHLFGYTLFEKSRNGWEFKLKDANGRPVIGCHTPGPSTNCETLSER